MLKVGVDKYHLLIGFTDGSNLIVRLTSMGSICAVGEDKLQDNYMYKQDFLSGISCLLDQLSKLI